MTGRIGTSIGAAHWSVGLGYQHNHTTQAQPVGLGHRALVELHPVGLDHRHELFFHDHRLQPSSTTWQHKKQPGASSHATILVTAS